MSEEKGETHGNQILWEMYLHSNAAAAELGIGLLKSCILINAGAIVALFAFIGQIWKDDTNPALTSALANQCELFIWGLVCAVLASCAAYFYQSALTSIIGRNVDKAPLQSYPTRGVHRIYRICRIMMIALTFASIVLFIGGTIRVCRLLTY